MNQVNKNVPKVEQFQYQGRWVDKQNFRAFVYDLNGNEKIANSYQDFMDLTSTGIWYESKPEASPQKRKQKHDTIQPTS